MRNAACLTVVLITSASVALAQNDTGLASPIASATDSSRIAREEEKLVIEALSRKFTLNFRETPLIHAIEQVSLSIDRDLLVDMVEMGEQGISMDQTVTLQLGEMTAWQSLHFLLSPLHLTWVANDGVIEITTEDKASDVFVTRVYDVRDLCKRLEPLTKEMFVRQRRGKPHPAEHLGVNFFSVPSTVIAASTLGQFGGGGAGGGQRPVRVLLVPKSVEAVLADMIRACSGLSWEDDGGHQGSIQLGQGCLIVSQTYQGQFEIAGMLQALQQMVEGKVTTKSIAARRIGYPAEEDSAIYEKLRKPTTLKIEAEPLEQVLMQIAQTAGIRLWIDVAALADDGISVDQHIEHRRRMQKLPLSICLKKILEPFRLTFAVDEGVLVITNQTRADEMMSVRFYDIGGITKIANEDRETGVVSVLSRSTRGHWSELEGNGGSAALVSSKHLAVRQSRQVQTEIELLIEDLATEALAIPVEPAIELRVYTVPDADTARDLERALPQMLESHWSIRGSIRQAGTSLLVSQPESVHVRLDEIIRKIEHSRKASPQTPTQTPKPEDPVKPEK